MPRERLGSRLGFILLSAGCAIGVGNVWKFPWMVGQYGGGAFVVCYVLFLLILGLPIMTMEFAIGRASQKSPVRAYQALEKPGSKWHIHGYLAMIGNYLLMMFYTTVCGWMLYYFYLTVSGRFVGATSEQVQAAFPEMLGKPVVMTVCMVAVVIVGFMINSFGLQGGLERVTKVMMIILLAIMVILAINSIMTEGSGEGLRFYLIPDLGRMQECGIANVIVAAMNQAFFTLSLGIGAMAIFGSYIGKGRALLGEAVNVAILDTFVAFTAGLIIFPACFAFGVAPDSGPNLIFVTLPNIFNHMALGRLWGSLFTLVRYEAADYESLLAYGTEPEAFARDADGRYYSFTDTDGSLYRGEDGPTPEEEARWAALQETIPQLRADFITRNGLEPFDEAALLAGPFTYEGEHRYLEYSGTCGTYVLALSQPERQGEGGIWCVERWYRPGGGSGLVFPQQDGQAAAAVYAARQAERDGGDLSYDSPEGAAVHWISEYCGALSVSSGELTEVDGPEGTGREGEPTMAAALAYVFSGRDSAELWGCKDPGSGPWIELLYRQELATLQEWFGACAWERVDAAEEAPWDDSAVPPYGSYTMRLLSDGDIILHWNSPYVAVYLDGEGQIWRCTSGYDQLYRSLAERWAWKVAQGTPGYFSALTDEDGPALLAGAEGDRPLPDPGAVEAAMEALTWTPVEPAPAEEPEGVTVTDASGYYRMTFCPGNLVYYYMDDYWNFWFQGTGEAELYPLLLEQTA